MNKELERQMEFQFADGGMIMSKEDTDPVSGNEIPPGSTAEEVRDDIPASISEGEYIFPADVVQFYGVDKLEKMRDKAKESLVDMESRGRMGKQVQDDLPLSDEELQTAEGDDVALGFAEGGLTGSFNPSQYSYGGGGTDFQGEGNFGGGGVETRVYTNSAGEKRPVLFINGQPQGTIPEGFVPDTPEGRKALQTSDPTDTVSDLRPEIGANKDEARVEREDRKDVSDWNADDFESWDRSRRVGNALARGVGTFAGGALSASPIGAALGGQAVQKAISRDNENKLAEIRSRLSNPDLSDEERATYQSIADRLEKGARDDDDDGIFSGIFGDDGLLGKFFGGSRGESSVTPSDSLLSSVSAAVNRAPTTEGRSSVTPSKSLLDKVREATSGGNSSSSRSSSSSSSGSSRNRSNDSRSQDDRSADQSGSKDGYGQERATGGLVTKKKRREYKDGGLVKKKK